MIEITLNLDNRANQSIQELMRHYNIDNEAALITKALRILKVCAYVDQTNGQLIARKEGRESVLVF